VLGRFLLFQASQRDDAIFEVSSLTVDFLAESPRTLVHEKKFAAGRRVWEPRWDPDRW
jgi:hypothetical protein